MVVAGVLTRALTRVLTRLGALRAQNIYTEDGGAMEA